MAGKVDYKPGFRALWRYEHLGFEAKVRYAERLIEAGLEVAVTPALAWSGGKDSTVLLDLVRRVAPGIIVIYNNTGVEFPETVRFVRQVGEEWGLNLHVARPEKGKDFWWCLERYGFPLLGKSFDRHVQDPGAMQSERQRKVMASGARVSSRCCYYCKEKPSLKLQRQLGVDLLFLGIMAHESQRRRLNWCRYGDLYWHKDSRTWKAHPLSVWGEDDVTEYHKRFNLPLCELYSRGHERNGCWPCGMDYGFQHGNHLATLRRTHPKLWHFLMVRKGLAKELLKIKLALGTEEVAGWEVEDLIRYRPCFFDRL